MSLQKAILLLRAKPDNKDAWATVYTETKPALIAYAASIIFSFGAPPIDTEDLVHDSLLSVIERWPEIQANIPSIADLKAYLRATVRNRLIDLYRKEKTARHAMTFLSLTFSGCLRSEAPNYRRVFLD